MTKHTFHEIKEFVSKPLFDEKVLLNNDPSYPKVSIVTPSYNQAEFLERTILSVLNQNYPNLEYIIIDGNSTDGSVEIIKKHEKYLAYWISEKDKGQSNALNKGLKVATGEWIGWQNSDDFYLPGAFDAAVKLMDCNPGYDVYYANKVCVDASGRVIRKQFYTRPSQYVYRYVGMTICNQACFIRHSVFDSIGLLDSFLNFAMDHEFFLRMLLLNIPMKHTNQFWGASRYHRESKSCNDNMDAWNKELNQIYDKYNLRWRGHDQKYHNLLSSILRMFYLLSDNGIVPITEKLRRSIYSVTSSSLARGRTF